MADELKPCPFCGGEAEIINQHDPDAVVHSARCLRCGTKTVPFLREEDAIMRWNTRYERTCGYVPSETQLVHAATVIENGAVVSVCEIERIDGAFNMSVSTIAPYENRGYASDCVRRAVLWWGQSVFHLANDLNWWARRDNGASIRIAEKNGFVLCGENDCSPGFVKRIIPAEVVDDED